MIWIIAIAIILGVMGAVAFFIILSTVFGLADYLSRDEPIKALERDIDALKLEIGMALLPVICEMMEIIVPTQEK